MIHEDILYCTIHNMHHDMKVCLETAVLHFEKSPQKKFDTLFNVYKHMVAQWVALWPHSSMVPGS